MPELNLSNPWVIGGGVVGLGVVAYYLYNNYGTTSTDGMTGASGDVMGTGGAVLGGGLPTSIGSDSTGLGGGADLTALTDAITQLNAGNTTSDAVQLAQINASQLAAQEKEGTTVFNSLIKSLNAHKGLGRISASVPGLGTVSTWYGKPTKVITKPAPKPPTKPKTKPKK